MIGFTAVVMGLSFLVLIWLLKVAWRLMNRRSSDMDFVQHDLFDDK